MQLNRDVGGPIGRTVTDVAKLFTALTDFSMFPQGYDPRDPVTAFRLNYTLPSNYTQFLNANGLQVCVSMCLERISNVNNTITVLLLLQMLKSTPLAADFCMSNTLQLSFYIHGLM